jgi:hypothetical protein
VDVVWKSTSACVIILGMQYTSLLDLCKATVGIWCALYYVPSGLSSSLAARCVLERKETERHEEGEAQTEGRLINVPNYPCVSSASSILLIFLLCCVCCCV